MALNAALQPDRVLLLDAFSLVVVFLGSTVDAWQRAGYHENPDHADFRCRPAMPYSLPSVVRACVLPVHECGLQSAVNSM